MRKVKPTTSLMLSIALNLPTLLYYTLQCTESDREKNKYIISCHNSVTKWKYTC